MRATSDGSGPAVLANDVTGVTVPAPAGAVVVGGWRGIGLEVGRLLGQVGPRVLLAARSGTALAEAVRELTATGVDAECVRRDWRGS